jgi:HSP20 family protein
MIHLEQQTKTVPVRMYQSDDRIMVATPLPGLEPEDISVAIVGTRVAIRGKERGPGQHGRALLLAEWTIGPYYREVVLPEPVNGTLTNATYGNGVLVLAMPKLGYEWPAVEVVFQLQAVGATTHGERIGHNGSTISPTTTQEHQRKHDAEGPYQR